MTLLQQKLADFRRRYYQLEILRGVLLLILVAGGFFLSAALAESVLWMGTTLRSIVVFLVILSGVQVFAWFIIRPILELFNLRAGLTYDRAARLIGRHFPEVQDRLLNVLQLEKEAPNPLLLQAIAQRTQALTSIPFRLAIDRTRLKRLLPAAGFFAGCVLLLSLFHPGAWDGSYRLLRFSQPFHKPAPYTIDVQLSSSEVVENEDVTATLTLTGKKLPQELFLFYRVVGNDTYIKSQLTKVDPTRYTYTFKNIHATTSFYVADALYQSTEQQITVRRRPKAASFRLALQYPSYSGIPSDTIFQGQGNVSVLCGTRITWLLENDLYNDNVYFVGPTDSLLVRNNLFSATIFASINYHFSKVSQDNIASIDTVQYAIQVQKDRYPSVFITEPEDSKSQLPANGYLPLSAQATDDFGFSRASFHYRLQPNRTLSTDTVSWQEVELQPQNGSATVVLEFLLSALQVGMQPGDVLEYKFVVRDNDAVSGYKQSESAVYTVLYESVQDQYDELSTTSESIASDLEGLKKEADDIQRQIEEFQKRMFEKKDISYEDKQELQQLLQRKEELYKEISKAAEKLQNQTEQTKQSQLLGKQNQEQLEQLEEYMEQLQDPGYQEFLRDIQKQMDRLSKKPLQQVLKNLESDNETLQRALERTMELYRQWQANQKVEELIERVTNLEQRQQQLLDQLNQNPNKEDQQRIAQRQEELAQEMKAIEQELARLQDLKKQTQTPDTEVLDSLRQQSGEIEQQQQQGAQELNQGRKQKAKQSQENALQRLQQMNSRLQQMQKNDQEQQTQENYEQLRSLLENLLKLSFDQESLRDEVAAIHYNDPALLKKTQEQDKLREDMRMIGDSLVSLSKRVIQIENYVLDELQAIENGMDYTLVYLTGKQISRANAQQHEVMTHLNNLANLLVESLTSLQDQLNQMQGGKPQNRPMGRPSMQQLILQQQMMNQQMQEKGEGQMSEQERAEFANQQRAIKERLQQLYEELEKEGKSSGGLKKALEEMEQTAEELEKQGLTKQTLQRQETILNRLLDYEKSLREKEEDTKRKSDSAEEQLAERPESWKQEEYVKRVEQERLRQRRLRYAPYYQGIIDSYFLSLQPK